MDYSENLRSSVTKLLDRVKIHGSVIGGANNLHALDVLHADLIELAGLVGSAMLIVNAALKATDIEQQAKEVQETVILAVNLIPKKLDKATFSASQAYTVYNQAFNANLRVTAAGVVTHDQVLAPPGYAAPFTPVYKTFLVDADKKDSFTITDAENFKETKPEGPFVAFLLVELDDAYKKKINSFDDWLSAPVGILPPIEAPAHPGISELKKAIDQVIYSANLVDKFANNIIRKKAMNPLISDDLVSMTSQAGKQAGQAVLTSIQVLDSL